MNSELVQVLETLKENLGHARVVLNRIAVQALRGQVDDATGMLASDLFVDAEQLRKTVSRILAELAGVSNG